MEDGEPEQIQQVNDEGLPINPQNSTIPEEILLDMQNVWSVFKTDGDRVNFSDLRVIMRALDFDLDANQLEIIRQKIDPNQSDPSQTKLKFENLEEIMEEKLKDVDTVDDLIALFKKLDKNDDGEIPVPEFKTYMLTMGSKLAPEEIDAMIKEAGGDTSGVIDIASFCERLCPQPPPDKKKA